MALHSVESLEHELNELVEHRQALRSRGAAVSTLERNRKRIAQLQQQFSLALLARYLPQTEAA
jgi:hypothetical protein